MESAVTGMVLASAKRMGIPADSVIVAEAVETAVLAVREGRDLDLSYELGASVLVRAMQPAA